MSQPKNAFSTEVLSLASAFAILALAGFVTMRADEHRRQSAASLRHTLMVESALQRFSGALRRAESEERGYLLTRDPHYFDAGEDSISRINKEFDTLSKLVAGNPAQDERLARIRPILRQRLHLLNAKVDLVKEDRFNEAIDLVRSGSGKKMMDDIDALASEMIAEEEQSYREDDEAFVQATQYLQTAIGSMILVVIGVGAFTIALTRRQTNALLASGESLRLSYDRLIEETARREAAEAQLRQSQKLEALGQLTGGIAHDFNNLLTVIVASLNLLRRRLARNEGGYEPLIDSALDSADNAANLVKRLLAFSRIQPLAPAPLDVAAFLTGMSAMLTRTLGAGIEMETRPGDYLWSIKVDANELQNAILNLAVNARDAMPGGGRLTIAAVNRLIEAEDPALDAPPAGAYVVVSVGDTGEGMSPEVLAKAFDPFFTTKPVGKGTGLGLSQVHGFVKQSGGHVRIRSDAGAGTTIELYLPRYRSDEATDPARDVGAAST
jgi:signal transduction histidine kinase